MKLSTRRRGFTLVELLVVVGIIAVLVGILIPMLAVAREAGRCTVCLSNLRQIGQAFNMYANDHGGYVVPGDYFGQSDIPTGTYTGCGNWAVILAEGMYLPIPEATVAASGPSGHTVVENPFLWDIDNVLRCPDYVDVNVATSGFPTAQTDLRGANYVIRHSDISGVGARTWYAINGAPYQRFKGGKPLPMQWIPDRDPITTLNEKGRLNKFTSFNNIARLPLIFDGVWTLDFDATGAAYDINRINARHYYGKNTNVLYADSHCETDATNTLPNDDWYCQ
ncbi:MAG TPA: prepilin-type N-terminal cleavage/methylation domain-containing protein [Tepidisphaeraceae bacterium]|jgi:prepilin-type N-terminal cleavage/methylation domain-containing protein|nr:prepilin-type N-terminal cleavage/methylation domain-containing protein [Tepidisphaeraceae bacterium]